MSGRCGCRPKRFKPVTHVIFDLDGVILDSESLYEEAFRRTMRDYGRDFDWEFYREVSGLTSLEAAKAAKETYALKAAPEEIVEKYRSYSREGSRHLELLPGVEKLIKHLHRHGVPMAIATASTRQSFETKTEKFTELVALFSHVVCGDDPQVRRGKPQPDEYLVCASRFPEKPTPSECLVFEDSVNGMRAGLAAQMQVVLIPNKTVPDGVFTEATLSVDGFEGVNLELFGLPALL